MIKRGEDDDETKREGERREWAYHLDRELMSE